MTDIQKPELLLCPFCGGEPRYIHHATCFDGRKLISLTCKDCGFGKSAGYDPELTKAWNTRADGWQPIEKAKKDGSQEIIWISPVPELGHGEDYGHATTARWTEFNDGGWIWHGLAGLPTHVFKPTLPKVDE